jgi:hypothetical protein
MRVTATAVLASVAVCGGAIAQDVPPPNRVYTLHTPATGPCPALDWHIGINDAKNTLTGIIAWGEDMENLARVSGTFKSGSSFEMIAHEVGGQNRTAEISGYLRKPDNYMISSIKGPNISCENITIPWFKPPSP